MFDQFQVHGMAATRAQQGILPEAVLESFGEGSAGNDTVAFRIDGRVAGKDLLQLLPCLFVARIAVEAIVADALKAFG